MRPIHRSGPLALRHPRSIRLHALALAGILPLAALGVCALPVAPGCSPGASLPQGEELLGAVMVGENLTASVQVDRDGRSMFHPDFTVWMLRAPAVCRTLPRKDLTVLVDLWDGLPSADRCRCPRGPQRPCLRIVHVEGEKARIFAARPDGAGEAGSPPELRHAVARTLDILHRTYGDRLLRELRAAGLDGLMEEPPG